MITSPQSGPEFSEGIQRTLADGEDLICFANAWQVIGRSEYNRGRYPDGSADLIHYENIYLALTNINIRIGVWKTETKKTGRFKKEISVLPECEPRNQFGVEEVVLTTAFTWKHTFSKAAPCPIPELIQSIPNPSVLNTIFFLRLSLSNSLELEVASIYDSLKNFGQNLDQRKSGSLLAKETSKAAGALGVLTSLLEEGMISQEEFERAKGGFLGTTTEVQESSASQIRQLHSLHRDGVLTEGEFNMKKWDILSKN